MKPNIFSLQRLVCFLILPLLGFGCESESRNHEDGSSGQAKQGARNDVSEQPLADKANSAKPAATAAEIKKTSLGKDVWLETQGQRRRVLVGAQICLRENGYGLECLLCRKHTKEHESILSTEADAQIIHLALLAAGANSGSPVKYVEKGTEVTVVPPTGDRIKVLIQYEDKGKLVTVPAQQWIQNSKTKKDLEGDWVFAGSQLFPNPEDDKKKPVYGATTEGGYICVLNVTTALLDLPLNNPNKDPELRELQPHTARIPPVETKVTLILEPQPEAKKSRK